jgi:WhiB family redox-sensing transcriptional regulator
VPRARRSVSHPDWYRRSMVDDEYADAEYATATHANECPDLSLLAHRPCWQRRASCRGADTDLWFPTASKTGEAARAICESCPVQSQCLMYALASPELVGIWAGTDERERGRMRRASA